MFEAILSIPCDVIFWSKLHVYETYFQKDDRDIFQFPILQINRDFLAHKQFPQFWSSPYENCDTHLKTGSVTANAGAVGIIFRCLETASQMSWIIGECTIILDKVWVLYIYTKTINTSNSLSDIKQLSLIFDWPLYKWIYCVVFYTLMLYMEELRYDIRVTPHKNRKYTTHLSRNWLLPLM